MSSWAAPRPAATRGRGRPVMKAVQLELDCRFESSAPDLKRSGQELLGFEEWGAILGDEVMAAALIDRLLHHCHVVNIRGNSYRMREHTDLLRAISPRAHDARASKPKRRPRREGSTT